MRPTLVIADLHAPFIKGGYLEFVRGVNKDYRCGPVVQIGDLVDQHALSPSFAPNPDAAGALDELDAAKKMLREWARAFPEMTITLGNHDARCLRKAALAGIPSSFFRPLGELYGTPRSWRFCDRHESDGVLYLHGHPGSGQNLHRKLATINRQSCVCGHTHSSAGVELMASHKDLIFGANVGAGIDDKSYAMVYAANQPQKSVISCGLVFNRTSAAVIPMPLGERR